MIQKPNMNKLLYHYIKGNIFLLSIIFTLIFDSINVYAVEKPITTDSRMKVFVHNPYEVYPLLFHHKYMSYIDFPEDEKVKSVSLGESTGWRIEVDSSRIYIQPIEGNVKTNMIVTTGKKRNYVFDIHAHGGSEMNNDVDITYSVRFFYPMEEEKKELSELIDQITNQIDSEMTNNDLKTKSDIHSSHSSYTNNQFKKHSNIEINTIDNIIDDVKKYGKINKYYTYSGTAKISPIEVFDDSRMTYIVMEKAENLPINVGYFDKKKNVQPLKSIVNNNVLIINQVIDKVVLYYSQDEYLILHKN